MRLIISKAHASHTRQCD